MFIALRVIKHLSYVAPIMAPRTGSNPVLTANMPYGVSRNEYCTGNPTQWENVRSNRTTAYNLNTSIMITSDNSTAAWSKEVKKSSLEIDYFYGWMQTIEDRGWNIGKERYVVGSSVYNLLCEHGISDYKGMPIEVDYSIHEAMIKVI